MGREGRDLCSVFTLTVNKLFLAVAVVIRKSQSPLELPEADIQQLQAFEIEKLFSFRFFFSLSTRKNHSLINSKDKITFS